MAHPARAIPAPRPRINAGELVMVTVSGQVAHPIARTNPYRIGYDGASRVLPGTGGIVVNRRIGDRCIGLAGDHIEPGAALHNNGREVVGPRDGPNAALLTYACVGNTATISSGPCAGQRGIVTGKHGGVNHLLVDFPTLVLARLRIGDMVQVLSHGLGARLTDHPDIELLNCSPRLLHRWGIREMHGKLHVPVTHLVPSAIMGSGLGKNTSLRGDYDIQLADADVRQRFRLGSLRFGDLVAIVDADNAHGPLFRTGRITIGVIVHADSTVSGHGPGVTALMSGPCALLRPLHDANANIAHRLGVRRLATPRNERTLVEKTRARVSSRNLENSRLPRARNAINVR
jgi:hypothetical protein